LLYAKIPHMVSPKLRLRDPFRRRFASPALVRALASDARGRLTIDVPVVIHPVVSG